MAYRLFGAKPLPETNDNLLVYMTPEANFRESSIKTHKNAFENVICKMSAIFVQSNVRCEWPNSFWKKTVMDLPNKDTKVQL